MWKIGNVKIKNRIVFAPMAGISNESYRYIIKSMGAGLIYLINLIGNAFEFHIGLNIVTSIFVGILGLPGAILLIIVKIFLN